MKKGFKATLLSLCCLLLVAAVPACKHRDKNKAPKKEKMAQKGKAEKKGKVSKKVNAKK